MCRLFGMSGGPEPVTARFWLLRAPDSLAAQGAREPDGTGLGWFDGARAHVSKQPFAADADPKFAREARSVRSKTFVAHVRYATTGSLTPANTHPFEMANRLFAHNGMVEDLAALEAELAGAMATVKGATDSERLFALITREIEHHGDVVSGVAAAVGWVAENLRMLAVNFVMIDAENLWALRYPAVHDLFVLERAAGGGTLRHARGPRIGAESDELARRPATVVATERMDDDPGWRQIPEGTLVHVDRALTLTEHPIRDSPPAHPLSLAELEGRAAAAQTA